MPTNTVLTRYEVLYPAYQSIIEGLYKPLGYVYYETEANKSKTPEWIKDLLIKSGEYASNIRVIYTKG